MFSFHVVLSTFQMSTFEHAHGKGVLRVPYIFLGSESLSCVSLYDLGQSSPHEFAFGAELGSMFVLFTIKKLSPRLSMRRERGC